MTDIEVVKSKLDIVELISEHVTLKKAGRHFKACCPFHNEKTPSFVVSPERQSWHCFGACSEGGDAISFFQKWENLEFPEALKILADRVGVKLASYMPDDKARLKERIYAANTSASAFYNYILTTHRLGEKAREYLKERGIIDKTIKTFSLGYSPDSWDSLTKYLRKKGFSDFEITTAGLSIKSERGSFYDRFRGRLMFTLCDHRGNIVGFSGRKLPPQSEKEAKYVNTQETPVYVKGNTLYGLEVTKEYIKKANGIIAVEGEFDMLSSFQAGVTNVVAIKGSALTEGQVMLIKRYTENIKLALDADFAGNEASRRGIEVADAMGLNIKVVRLSYGKDPADCVAKAPHLWKESVEKAVPVYDFIIDAAMGKYDSREVDGKKKISAEIAPFISKITNPIVKSHYVKKISALLSVSEESVEEMLEMQFKKTKINDRAEKGTSKPRKREELLEEILLGMIISSDNAKADFSKADEVLDPDDFSMPAAASIFMKLGEFLKDHEKLEVEEFSKRVPPELNDFFDRIFLSTSVSGGTEKEGKLFMSTVYEIRRFSLRRKLNIFSTKLGSSEQEADGEDAQKIRTDMNQTLLQLQSIEKMISAR